MVRAGRRSPKIASATALRVELNDQRPRCAGAGGVSHNRIDARLALTTVGRNAVRSRAGIARRPQRGEEAAAGMRFSVSVDSTAQGRFIAWSAPQSSAQCGGLLSPDLRSGLVCGCGGWI